MVDRVSAAITIGGTLSPRHLPEFIALVSDEDLSLDYDGEPFSASHLTFGVPLSLMAHEVALGQFSRLEDFCVARSLPFRRWSGGCHAWGPQCAIFGGEGEVRYVAAHEGEDILLDRETAAQLGSIEAILAWFDDAQTPVPPLMIGGDGQEADDG